MHSVSRAVQLRINNHAWALVMLMVIALLNNLLSESLTVGHHTSSGLMLSPQTLNYVWLATITALLLVAAVLWLLNHGRPLRLVILVVNGLFTVQLFVAALLIVVRLLQSVDMSVTTLLADAMIVFVTNTLIFALWYWYDEVTNPLPDQGIQGTRWDLLFPQRQEVYPGYEDWQPRFWDYLFLAYTTSVAFSPTDTLPLSRSAKLLMMTQSAIALIAIVVVAGTAINILAGSA